MNLIASVILSTVLWPLYVAVQVPLWLAGFPICYALAQKEEWFLRPSRYFKGRIVSVWLPWWAWAWGNEQDGVTGPEWWHSRNPGKSQRWLAFVWSAWRNPVNNLRFVKRLHPVIEPAAIRFHGNSDDPARSGTENRKRIEWAYTWQVIYAGLVVRWQITKTHHASVRLGWKLIPRDRLGVPDDDYRRIRCPFGVQFHPWRKS